MVEVSKLLEVKELTQASWLMHHLVPYRFFSNRSYSFEDVDTYASPVPRGGLGLAQEPPHCYDSHSRLDTFLFVKTYR